MLLSKRTTSQGWDVSCASLSSVWINFFPSFLQNGGTGLFSNPISNTVFILNTKSFSSVPPLGSVISPVVGIPVVDKNSDVDRFVAKLTSMGATVVTIYNKNVWLNDSILNNTMFDFTESIVTRSVSKLDCLPSRAFFPLFIDDKELETLVSKALALGVENLQGVEIKLTPKILRILVEKYKVELRYFHKIPLPRRTVSKYIYSKGIWPFVRRFKSDFYPTELTIVENLIVAAELLAEMDKEPSLVSQFIRAARWMEEEYLPLKKLRNVGNLNQVPWLSQDVRTVVEDFINYGKSKIVEQIVKDYLE